MKQKLILNENSPKEKYEELFKLPKGEVVKVTDYETVMQRIEDYKPTNVNFEVFPITPGTDLYTMYGCDHVVVTENTIVTG